VEASSFNKLDQKSKYGGIEITPWDDLENLNLKIRILP
jgi:hypothetical protein